MIPLDQRVERYARMESVELRIFLKDPGLPKEDEDAIKRELDRRGVNYAPRNRKSSVSSRPLAPREHDYAGPPQSVTVADVSMPFGSMVVFILKWSLASIPAMIILFIIFFFFYTMFLSWLR